MTKHWPEGDDPVARELRRAFDEARLRGPDEVTLRRGWSGLAELLARRPPSRTRRWPNLVGFAGGVALTVACAALFWPRSVESPAGGVAAGKRPTSSTPTSLADDPGVRVLTLEGGVKAQLGSTSVMRLEAGDPRVDGGEVWFSVPRRQPGRPFVVRAEQYRVIVIGTRFGVAVDDSRNVAIEVKEGVVEVWSDAGRLARLVPGDSWRSPERTLERAAASKSPSEDGVRIAAPEKAAHAAPASGRRTQSATAAKRTVALATPGGGTAPASGPSEGPPGPAGDPAIAARAALASGDVPRALQIYKTAAQRSGPAAENAAYEMGKILSDRMGQPANAVAAWRRYRAAYPEGILRLEADVSIIETLARMGEADEALAEATDFLRRHPESERRGEIARVAGDLYRARGDCRRAITVYQVALGAARSRDVAESAAFHRAECQVRVGDAGGPDAARGYLRAYPSGRFRAEASALLAGSGGSP